MSAITVNVHETRHPSATINGKEIPAGDSLYEVCILTAKEIGLGSFRVTVNGVEFTAVQAKTVAVKPGDVVQLTPYDKAGSR